MLRLCIDNMNESKLVELFKNISQKQRKKIIKALEDNDAEDISKILNIYRQNQWNRDKGQTK